MSNHFPQQNYEIFHLETALENLQDEAFIKGNMPMFLQYFDEGKGFDELIQMYRKGNWQVIGTPEYKDFEKLAHSIKGCCRYLGINRLEKKLEKLQFCIRDGEEIQVGTILDEVLEQCPYAQKAVLKYMEMPDDKIRYYKPVTQFYDYSGNVHIRHKLDYVFHRETCKISMASMPYQPQSGNHQENEASSKQQKALSKYKKGNWQVIGSQEQRDFEKQAHYMRGFCRLLGINRLEMKLNKLQYAIQDGGEIQVGTILDEVLEQCPYTQKAILKYMKMPDDKIRYYKPVTQFYDYSGNVHIRHKLDYVFHRETSKISIASMPYQPKSGNHQENQACQLI